MVVNRNEFAQAPEQRFDGTLEEISYTNEFDTDRLLVTQLEARLDRNGLILIPGIQAPNPYMSHISLNLESGPWTVRPVAVVNFGQPDIERHHKEALQLISLHNQPAAIDHYKKKYKIDDPAWLVLAQQEVGTKPIIGAETVLNRSIGLGIMGKETNLPWHNFSDVSTIPGWNPFNGDDLPELILTVRGEYIQVWSRSDVPVTVNTRASKEHLRILGA